MVSCISLPKAVEAGDIGTIPETSWTAIVAAIRAYARTQPPEQQTGLLQWADFISGIAEMQGAVSSAV